MRTLLGLLFIASFSHAAVPPTWKEISAVGVEKMWKSNEVKDAFLSVYKSDSSYKLEDFDAKAYVSAIPELRSFMHKLMGIKDYQINKHHSERTSDAWIVKIEGTYLRQGKESVNFCELHKFSTTSFKQNQLLYPSASSGALLNSEDCFEVIKKVVQ